MCWFACIIQFHFQERDGILESEQVNTTFDAGFLELFQHPVLYMRNKLKDIRAIDRGIIKTV